MNMKAGSKKFIKAVAAEGRVESRTIRSENIQNIPNNALGNLMAAATNAFFKYLSIARISPRDTIKWKSPTTLWVSVEEEVPPDSVPADFAEISLLLRIPSP